MKRTIALVLILVTGSAFADFGGVTVGDGRYDIDIPGAENGADSEHAMSVSVLYGWENRYGSLEVEYSHMGTYWIRNHVQDNAATVQTIGAAFVVNAGPAFVKLGGEAWLMDVTLSGHPSSETGFGAVYGAGLQWGDKVRVRIGYDIHDGIDNDRVNVESGIQRAYAGVLFGL